MKKSFVLSLAAALSFTSAAALANEQCLEKETIHEGMTSVSCFVRGRKVQPSFGEYFLTGRIVRLVTPLQMRYELYSGGGSFLVSCDEVVIF